MYETIRRLYEEGKLTETGLSKAVSDGLITEEQKEEIMNI